MNYDLYMSNDVPELSQQEINTFSDMHLLNGVAFAIAVSGKDKTNDLAELVGVESGHENILATVRNIMRFFNEMHVYMDLSKDRTFIVRIELKPHGDEGTLPVNVTIQ